MNRILRIGLTGGVGSGKSTACKLFEELDIPVIDADHIAHQLVKKDGDAYQQIKKSFGTRAIMNNGEIDRKYLRELVFSNVESRNKLENILHPMIFTEIENQVANLNSAYCIICLPLLIETNSMDKVDRILIIDTPLETQIERASKRDGVRKETIMKIIASQVTRDQRLKVADDIIDNNDGIDSMREQILLLNDEYKLIANERFIANETS